MLAMVPPFVFLLFLVLTWIVVRTTSPATKAGVWENSLVFSGIFFVILIGIDYACCY